MLARKSDLVLFDTCGVKSEGGWWGRERPYLKVV